MVYSVWILRLHPRDPSSSGIATTPGPGRPGPKHQNQIQILIMLTIIPCNIHAITCQVYLFEVAFQKQSKGRQWTIFDCLDVNQSDSSDSK